MNQELQTALDNLDSDDPWPLTGRQIKVLAEAARRQVAAQAIVDEQAEDEGLWFPPSTSTTSETYLRQALRRLSAAIERATE